MVMVRVTVRVRVRVRVSLRPRLSHKVTGVSNPHQKRTELVLLALSLIFVTLVGLIARAAA